MNEYKRSLIHLTVFLSLVYVNDVLVYLGALVFYLPYMIITMFEKGI